MKNYVKAMAIGCAAFVIGMGVNNFAMSDALGNCKIAVVDVQQVVAASSQVNDLKKENQEKTTEIINFIEKARKDVAATTDTEKKKSLEEKYSKELNTKREAYGLEYNNKMMNIQNNILNAVAEQARANNYDLVLAKDVVLYGGDDITDSLKTKVASIKSSTSAKKSTPAKKKK